MDKIFIPEPKLDGKPAEQIGAAIIKIVNDKDKEIILKNQKIKSLEHQLSNKNKILNRIYTVYPEMVLCCGNCKYGRGENNDWLHEGDLDQCADCQ